MQLRAVLDELSAHPDPAGPLPPVREAWQLLATAQQHAPSEVDDLLLHPQAGTWAGYLLRRLRGSSEGQAPLWVDVGYLHALAAAAAIRAGLEFATRVPVRDGFASIPTLGAAMVPSASAWEWAQVRRQDTTTTVTAAGRTVRLSGQQAEADGWVALPVVEVAESGHRLSVNLDHLDPYRDLRAPVAPQLLSPAEVARWRSLMAEAWRVVVATCPALAESLARGLFAVVPQPRAERFRTMSASAGDAFGATIVSEPEGATELAVTLVHEFQHIKLGGLLHLAPLQVGEPPQRLYAPWRDDPRPLSGVLQGVYAFTGITGFWCAYRRTATGCAQRLAQFEFARWREQVDTTLRVLQELPQLTDLGRRLVAGMATTAAQWRDQEVPADLLAAARDAGADHRTLWRAWHLRPDPQVVAELAAAWQAGAPRPDLPDPDPVVVADDSARGLDTRAVLTLWRLFDPDGFAALRRDPSTVSSRVTGATVADLAYVAGEVAYARQCYLADLATDPDRVGAWAGLALVEAAGPPTATAAVLRDRPELARAVHRQVRMATGTPPDPLALAEWLGRRSATAASDPGRSRPGG